MSSLAAPSAPLSFLPLRFALREMRGGLRGFYVFVACIALGVMAITGVGSVSRSLVDGLSREGRAILGGDILFSLIHREASESERAFLAAQGNLSVAATMRAMARAGEDNNALVELKAVDRSYPLSGNFSVEPAMPQAQIFAQRDGVFGAAADPALLVRLDIQPGARITVGNAQLEIRAAIKTEPDRLAGGVGFGPRLLIGEDALRQTGLLQPGSLVRWLYRIALPAGSGDGRPQTIVKESEEKFPEAGWEARTRANASPQLERNVERFTQFLALVGLTALLVGGVGVANAIRSHLDSKRDAIAAMKALGASSARIFAIYLTQVMLIALIGCAVGIALGASIPFLIAWAFGAVLPLPLSPILHLPSMGLGLMFGLLTALAFAMWPLGRAQDISVAALFRDEIASDKRAPQWRYLAATGFVIALLAGLSIYFAYDRKVALIFIGAAAASFVALRFIATGIMALARRLPHARSTSWRLAIANIHRPGALTPTIVLSLGLGVTLLVIITQIDSSLQRQFSAALPQRAPSFYFLDIPAAETARFDSFITMRSPAAKLERVPMLRGRIVAVKGVRAEDIPASAGTAWALQGDRGITYADSVPDGSRLIAGEWWPKDYAGPPLLSFEKGIAEGLNLKIGDEVTVNILGRNITAKIGNIRQVDWQSLAINFVLVYSPNTFAGAPHTHLATLTDAGAPDARKDAEIVKAASKDFPSVTAIRVKDALDAVGAVVNNLILAVRGASFVTLISAILVLGGALAAGHRARVYDAVVLKTLGATRGKLLGAYALEYFLLGLATAIFGVAAGTLAAWLIVSDVMNLSFVFAPVPALVAAFGALVVTVTLGLFGTFSALGRKPASVLRHL